ncbi:unnamed protein product [Rotaria sp. Silwood2]|nr:unnamed protein product [Rotaria sp. Silwood2]CAF2650857.1 unnamed protein product [Rotaria sp. Silwood2]CAF2907288.1 unnamed protein product [Rotaria sp. Silwood2]CAF3058221.1 unnamed protein product [Rotaria sp. Silwood2]CAF3871989.1 unnamed protein product [Rotaria sp. Silwood2]
MPGTTFEVVSDPLHHHGGLHLIYLKEITDDDDEQQGAIGSTTASASAAISVAKQFSNMSLGKEKNFEITVWDISKIIGITFIDI